ncbi:hypothetical protein, partial [Salinibacter altiplanensis]|uniref:hypothetical protein n=1 Tax=Salinibacter altiplanensis TaxID=1803181 RepID=UPI0024344D94
METESYWSSLFCIAVRLDLALCIAKVFRQLCGAVVPLGRPIAQQLAKFLLAHSGQRVGGRDTGVFHQGLQLRDVSGQTYKIGVKGTGIGVPRWARSLTGLSKGMSGRFGLLEPRFVDVLP